MYLDISCLIPAENTYSISVVAQAKSKRYDKLNLVLVTINIFAKLFMVNIT